MEGATDVGHDRLSSASLSDSQISQSSGATDEVETCESQVPETDTFIRRGYRRLTKLAEDVTHGMADLFHRIFPQQDPPRDAGGRLHQSTLITEWGAKVTAANAWRDYPRPQLKRGSRYMWGENNDNNTWMNLNGDDWEYSVYGASGEQLSLSELSSVPEWALKNKDMDMHSGKILVPFAMESRLSGVWKALEVGQTVVYRKLVDIPTGWLQDGGFILIHFGAVDYDCAVFVNQRPVGFHRGGYVPFSLDITQALIEDQIKTEILVLVMDDTDLYQPLGKQRLKPGGIFYTRVSGIWQTVWLEAVPERSIEQIVPVTKQASPEKALVELQVVLREERQEHDMVEVTVLKNDVVVVKQESGVSLGDALGGHRIDLMLNLPKPTLWSPDLPHIYDLEVTLLSFGEVKDKVYSYLTVRKVEVGTSNHDCGEGKVTFLNGGPIFVHAVLDQGWWPESLLTPPSSAAIHWELSFLRQAGFNCLRKHAKTEPAIFYYICDMLGMMVWQDMPSAHVNPPWESSLEVWNVEAHWPAIKAADFQRQLVDMVQAFKSFGCITTWTPFNERWGQHRTIQNVNKMRQVDPSRLINVASGGNFFATGEHADFHDYRPDSSFPTKVDFGSYIKAIGEYGGHGFIPDQKNLYDPQNTPFSYNLAKTKEELVAAIERSFRSVAKSRKELGVMAACYTQVTDVELEVNGLLTYNRKQKIEASKLRELFETCHDCQ